MSIEAVINRGKKMGHAHDGLPALPPTDNSDKRAVYTCFIEQDREAARRLGLELGLAPDTPSKWLRHDWPKQHTYGLKMAGVYEEVLIEALKVAGIYEDVLAKAYAKHCTTT